MLDHPNLIRVIDFALLENDSLYLVMEFIDGESLADILKRRGQLTEAEAIEVFLQSWMDWRTLTSRRLSSRSQAK